jgi:NADH:ubiquinone oxidoreductase subunit C
MTDTELIEKLKEELGSQVLEVTNPDRRRIFLKVGSASLLAAVAALRDKHGFTHLSTISGVDKGETFEILYHFAGPDTTVHLRTEIPRQTPHVESITPLIPGAILYEREVQDMFGIVFEHIPDPRRLLLADDWPAGQHPLRKDWVFERPEEIIPGGKS